MDRNVLFDFFCVTAAELFNRCAERFFCFLLHMYIFCAQKWTRGKGLKRGKGRKRRGGNKREDKGAEGVRNGNARKRNRGETKGTINIK